MIKKCFLCNKFIVSAKGYIGVKTEEYEIKKPLCAKCTKRVETEYNEKQDRLKEMDRGLPKEVDFG
jgi:hypothetical protein